MSRKPIVISLFSGAGGLDFGFEAAGFRTGVCVEMNSLACSTLRENRRWRIVEDDIHALSGSEIVSQARCSVGGADVLIGGPPCQPFSKSRYWTNGAAGLDDPRASTLGQYVRVLRETQPRAFLLENVRGISKGREPGGLEFLLREIAKVNRTTGANYRPTWAVLNATDYGVPQRRERFFMVAARDGTEFAFPNPTHFAPESLSAGAARFHTCWDALADVVPKADENLKMGGYWADLLPSLPEGQNYLYHTARGKGRPLFGWRRRFWSFLLKLAKDQPAWTIQAQPGSATGPFHWENRRLSMRELARLQTFPDNVQVGGNREAIQRQIGNAVPSLLAEILAREIRVQLLGRRAIGSPTLMPVARTDSPGPSRPSRLHPKYKHLEGQHEDHPGTGRGPAARLSPALAAG